jgi:hypothetical protein
LRHAAFTGFPKRTLRFVQQRILGALVCRTRDCIHGRQKASHNVTQAAWAQRFERTPPPTQLPCFEAEECLLNDAIDDGASDLALASSHVGGGCGGETPGKDGRGGNTPGGGGRGGKKLARKCNP